MISEAKRFFRIGSTLSLREKINASIALWDIKQRYKAEKRDNPDAYDLRSIKPLGTLGAAIANARLADLYGSEANIFFKHTDFKVAFTSTPFLSFVNEKIEYGTREIRNRKGLLETVTGLWYISPARSITPHLVTPNLLRALTKKGRNGIVEEFGSLTPDQIVERFQSSLLPASNYTFQLSSR